MAPAPPHTAPMNTSTPSDVSTRHWLDLADVQSLLLDGYPGIVLALSPEGRVRGLNAAARQQLGHTPESLAGQDIVGTLLAREEVEVRATQLATEFGEPVAAGGGVLAARLARGLPGDVHEWVLRAHDGELKPTRLAVAALRDAQGGLQGLLAVEPWPRSDDDATLALRHHDSLTGLPTRALLADRAEMALQRATRNKSVVAVLLVELAGFDALCETQGHSVGDDLLRATAGRLHFEMRKTDTAVRIDRGQFAALLVDLHDAGEAHTVAAKIRTALSAKVNVGVAVLHPEVRVGVATFPEHGNQLLPLLQAAEAALGATPPAG